MFLFVVTILVVAGIGFVDWDTVVGYPRFMLYLTIAAVVVMFGLALFVFASDRR